jgi:glycosyltransferase involved in cell wall biosynthesis
MEQHLTSVVTGLLDRGRRVTVVARECSLPLHPRLRFVRVPGPKRPFSIAYPWFFLVGSVAVWRHRTGCLHTTGAVVTNRADASTVHFCHRAFQAHERSLRASRRGLTYRLNAWVASYMSRVAEWYCYRPSRTRRLVAVSRGVAAELRRFYPAMAGSISVIPNGVDRDAFRSRESVRRQTRAELGLADDDLVALFVGGEWPRKGLRFAIDAIGRVPDWRLIVLGEGDTTYYRQLAEAARADGRIDFLGRRADTEPFYAAADAFLLPTAYEVFPLVVLEAAAAGVPLLATRVNGVEDILVDGENGWFVEPNGAAIAARLAELQRDQALRRRMGEAARAATEPYTWDRSVEAYVQLYEELDSDRERAVAGR